jgi:hypothetical protein
MLAEISKADAASSYDRREEQKIEGWLLIAEIANLGSAAEIQGSTRFGNRIFGLPNMRSSQQY